MGDDGGEENATSYKRNKRMKGAQRDVDKYLLIEIDPGDRQTVDFKDCISAFPLILNGSSLSRLRNGSGHGKNFMDYGHLSYAPPKYFIL